MNAETCLYHVRETRAYNITRAQERIRAGESARDERLLIAVMDRILEASNAASPEPVPATNQAGEVATPLPCPFCGENLMCDPNEGAPFWVHRNRLKSECWLADSWVKDEMDGEGGIREWNTRAALATQPATSQEGEVAKYADMDIAERATAMADDCVGDPWELLGFFREKLRQSEANAEAAKAAAIGFAQRLAAAPTPPTLSEDLRALMTVADALGDFDAAKIDSITVTRRIGNALHMAGAKWDNAQRRYAFDPVHAVDRFPFPMVAFYDTAFKDGRDDDYNPDAAITRHRVAALAQVKAS